MSDPEGASAPDAPDAATVFVRATESKGQAVALMAVA